MQTKTDRGDMAKAFVFFSLLALTVSVLSACTPFATASVSPTKTPALTGPLWGLPYKAGTTITLGCLGLHDDNIYADSVDGPYSFQNAKPQGVAEVSSTCPPPLLSSTQDPSQASLASLDLLSGESGVPIVPLAKGVVLVADQRCHFVVVDHGNQTWVAYLHINVQVTPHETVTPETTLGTTAPAPYNSACENSTAPHVHFAFLTGSGFTGSYIPMVGKVLCGYRVIKNTSIQSEQFGALQEIAHPQHTITPGQAFTVPTCPTSSTPAPSLNTIDWSNYTYTFSHNCGISSPQQVTLQNGAASVNGGNIGIGSVVYGDVTGDGIPEAAVAFGCYLVANPVFNSTLVIVFTGTALQPKQLAILPDPNQDPYFIIVRRVTITNEEIQLIGIGFSPSARPCCPDTNVTYTYRWNGRQFRRTTIQTSPIAS